MKIDHELALDLLPLYAEGMLSGRNCQLMEDHICGCGACQAALGELKTPAVPLQGQETAGGLRTLRRALRRRTAAVIAVTAFVVVLCALLIWSCFISGSDALGYAFLAMYVILPLAGFGCALALGLRSSRTKWLAPVVFGLIALLLPLLVFRYTEGTFFWFIFVPSMLGCVIGHIVSVNKKRKAKADA